jgi:hypothetical protein
MLRSTKQVLRSFTTMLHGKETTLHDIPWFLGESQGDIIICFVQAACHQLKS